MEKGSPTCEDGGSMRRNGLEEARRPLDRRPIRLCLGDPREAEMGVVVVVLGTESETGLRGERSGRLDEDGLNLSCNMNLEGLTGVPSIFLLRLEGELRTDGSIFSASSSGSSNNVADRARLPGEDNGCFELGELRDAAMARDACKHTIYGRLCIDDRTVGE